MLQNIGRHDLIRISFDGQAAAIATCGGAKAPRTPLAATFVVRGSLTKTRVASGVPQRLGQVLSGPDGMHYDQSAPSAEEQ
jgi:hypothetical protein